MSFKYLIYTNLMLSKRVMHVNENFNIIILTNNKEC